MYDMLSAITECHVRHFCVTSDTIRN